MDEKSKVLIVDDQPLGRETLEALLFREGYDLIFAGDGPEALAKAQSERPDVILLDIMMPGMDGFTVCEHLRKDPVLRDVPVIMITALDDRGSRIRGIESGADDFLTKPVDWVELRVRVRTILRLNRYRRLNEERSRFESMFRLFPDGMIILDHRGRIQQVNQAMLTLMGGVSEQRLLAQPVEFLVVQEEQGAFQRTVNGVLAGQVPVKSWVCRLQSQTGVQIPVEVVAGSFEWMGLPAVQVIFRDISARVESETRIREQLSMLQVLFSSSQVLSQHLDPQMLAANLVHFCVERLGATLAWIGQATPEGSLLTWKYAPVEIKGLSQIEAYWENSPAGMGREGFLLRRDSAVVTNDLSVGISSRSWQPVRDLQEVCAAASFPLLNRDTAIGVLVLFSDQKGFFKPERVELFQTFANQITAALENARLFNETRQRLSHIRALHAIDKAIMATPDLDRTLQVFLEQVQRQMEIDAACVLLYQPGADVLNYGMGIGFRHETWQARMLPLGRGLAGRVAAQRESLYLVTQDSLQQRLSNNPDFIAEEFATYFGIPLVAKGVLQGVLELFHRTELHPSQEWFEMIETLAGQAAIALENAALFERLQAANLELQQAYDATLEGWVRALDLRDEETEGHTQRVTELTLRLARQIGFSDDELVHIRRGALLHDIGKIGVPDTILLKNGPLTEEEWAIMRRHPVLAYELLHEISFLKPSLAIPYLHHERWDGKGYPLGLQGEDIPTVARLFAVVDVWDALRSNRPYRKAVSDQEALEYIRTNAGAHFDPQMVALFLDFLAQEAGH